MGGWTQAMYALLLLLLSLLFLLLLLLVLMLCNDVMVSCSSISLNNNQLSGTIPPSIGNINTTLT